MPDPVIPKSLEGVSAQDIANLAALAQTISSNPKITKQFKRLVKEAVPTADIPEIELEDRLEAASKGTLEEVAKLRDELKQRDARERLTTLEREAMQHGVSEAEIKDGSFQKWANEQGFTINQLDKAAKYRAMERQLSEPTPALSGPSLSPKMDATALKKMRENPDQFLMDNAMDEIGKINARKRMASA